MIELERAVGIWTEGAFAILSLEYDALVGIRDRGSLEACDSKIVAELGKTAATVCEACQLGNFVQIVGTHGNGANGDCGESTGVDSKSCYFLGIGPV